MTDFNGQLRGWSKRDTLITGSTNIIQLQANLGYIGYYTVQFAQTIPPGSLSEAGDIQTIADIIWTVRGNQVTRRVSVGNGTTISGMGEHCTVNVSDLSAEGNSTPYDVGVLIAPGSRPTSGSPPFIGYNTSAAVVDPRGVSPATAIFPNTSATFNIPLNVGVNSVYLAIGASEVLANSEVDFLDFTRATINGSAVISSIRGNAFNRWVPVPPAASTMTVTLGAYPNIAGITVTPLWGIEG